MTWAIVLSVASVSLCSCESQRRLPTYPVVIVAAYADGAPIAGGHITLRSAEHGISASGSLDADGKSKVGTYEHSDGAVQGKHQVAIVPARPPGDPDKTPAVPTIDRRYFSPATSGLEIDVQPDGPSEFRLEVARLKHQ